MPSSTLRTPASPHSAASAPGDLPLLAGVLAFTALVYAATIRFQFTYDDQGYIVQNGLVHSWRYVPLYFQGGVWQDLFPFAPANYYRPMNLLWTRFNHALFGLQPAGWHALAICLHLCATALVFVAAKRLTDRLLVAAVAALLFGIHPIHHEVVAWASGTTESIWSVLFLLAFLAYLNSRDARRAASMAAWLAASCALYGAALLAKEPAILFPAVVCAHAWIYGAASESASQSADQTGYRTRISRVAMLGAAYVPVMLVYLAARVHALHGFSHPQSTITAREYLMSVPEVLAFYARQWLLPIRYSEFYPLHVVKSFSPAAVLLPLLGLLLVVSLLWFFREALGKREVLFCSAWMFFALLPTLDFAVLPPGDMVHDRYFYLASFGAALLVALAIEKLAANVFSTGPLTFGMPRGLILAGLCIFPPLAYSAANASSYWMNDFVLFSHARAVAPENIIVRGNYAAELAGRGDFAAALPLMTALVQDQPNNYLANYNLARLFYQSGDLNHAETYFTRAQALYPTSPDPYLELGMVAFKRGQLNLAERDMRRAVALRPSEANYPLALGAVLVQEGDCDAAQAAIAKALALNPELKSAQQTLSNCRAPAAAESAAGARAKSPMGSDAP